MQKKLICFDLDGTLIDDIVSIWITLHDAFGVCPEKRKQHYLDFKNRRITYHQWFATDVQAWKTLGKKRQDFLDIIYNLQVMRGTQETLDTLKDRGHLLAIISGSLNIVVETLLPDHLFKAVLINQIFFDAEGHIEKAVPTPYDMEHKADGMLRVARENNIPRERCVFIGDYDNDIHIAEAAGLAIAFNSKSEKLNQIADVVLAEKDLRAILPYV